MTKPAALRANSRMELRLEEARKSRYQEAASLSGQTLTQWSLANLDTAAERALDSARSTRLARADFDAFCQALDQPMHEAARSLLESDQQWA